MHSCNSMCLRGSKTHYFPHSVHYCCSTFLKRVDFLQSSSFWEARCAMIGQIYSALWLAEYLKRVMEMLCPLPCCDAVSRRDETKTIKPTIHEAFVAFSEDIITYYNDSFCLFTGFAALHKHNAMSAFVIVETPNKHYTTQLKTRVWIVNSKYRNILTDGVRSTRMSLRHWKCPTL